MISDQSITEAKYVISKKGKCMLMCYGYKYVKRGTNSESVTSWRCSSIKNRRYNCSAKAYTKKQNGVEIVTLKGNHCHDAQF